MKEIVAHFIVFQLAAFTTYLNSYKPKNYISLFLFYVIPILGVYFFGWWMLLTFGLGFFIGPAIYVHGLKRRTKDTK